MNKNIKTIKKILKIPLDRRTIQEEYRLAKYESRQPNCVYCLKPLKIEQTQEIDSCWEWDNKKKCYVKNELDGSAEKPYCVHCETANWNFIDYDLINF